jgi:esterase
MKLFCEKQGAGPALVMAHGIFGSHENLGAIARLLVDHFTLYRVDLRNHGRSPHSETMTYADMAADIVELMDDHKLGNAAVLGHSLGGKVMMELATTKPERVNHLIVGDIAPVQYPSHHDPILQGLQAINLTSLNSRTEADEQLAKFVDTPMTRQFLLKNLQRNDQGEYFWRLNLPVIAQSYDAMRQAVGEGKMFPGPTLFIRGELSKYIQDRNIEAIQQKFPLAKIATIARASHWLHAEQPQQFFELVKNFIEGQ